jgi:SAM-dependent methyltransferase
LLTFGALSALGAAFGGCRSEALREPDVHYDPSPPEVVRAMLELGKVQASDVVYDLGCGDGRIVIAAVRERGARGVCIDIDPVRVAESRKNAERAGVHEKIEFRTEDLFVSDLSDATVVMLFLFPDVNLKLRPKLLRELDPGDRVVSHWHDMGDWVPDTTVTIDAKNRPRPLYLWNIGSSAAP